MLEDFKLSQENFYHEVIQFGLHQKFSHAYLIETKDYLDSDNLVLAFAKFVSSIKIVTRLDRKRQKDNIIDMINKEIA